MLLNILQCTEQLLTVKKCMTQDINSDKVEKFTLSFRFCVPHVSAFLMCLGLKEGLLHCSSFSSNRRQLLLVTSGLLFWGCMVGVGWCLCCFGPLSVLAQLYVLSLSLGLSQRSQPSSLWQPNSALYLWWDLHRREFPVLPQQQEISHGIGVGSQAQNASFPFS